MKLLAPNEIDAVWHDARNHYSVITREEIEYLLPACKAELYETGKSGFGELTKLLLRDVLIFRKAHPTDEDARSAADAGLRRPYESPELAKAKSLLAEVQARVDALDNEAIDRQKQHRTLAKAVATAEEGLAAIQGNRADLVEEIASRRAAWNGAISDPLRSEGDRAIDIMGTVLKFEAVLPQIDTKLEEQAALVKATKAELAQFEKTLK